MCKSYVKNVFKIEYILILISVIIFFATEFLKYNTNTKFESLDRSFSELQLLYGNSSHTLEEKDFLISKIQEECLPYIYFSTESKHKLIRILELFKYDAIPWNTNHQNSSLFTSLLVTFNSDIQKIQTNIMFGYDCMISCSIILLFLAAMVLIDKKNYIEDFSQESGSKKKKQDISTKDIIAYIIIITLSVLANYGGSHLAHQISVPLYLDSLLTIAVTALCGITSGIICAALSNTLLFIENSVLIEFVICHILTAIFAAIAFSHFRKSNNQTRLSLDIFLWAGLWSGISNALLGDFMANILYESSSASPRLDGSVLGLFIVLKKLTPATYLSGLFTNLSDKMLCAGISFIFYNVIHKIATFKPFYNLRLQ